VASIEPEAIDRLMVFPIRACHGIPARPGKQPFYPSVAAVDKVAPEQAGSRSGQLPALCLRYICL
jgi:hypothetical protein